MKKKIKPFILFLGLFGLVLSGLFAAAAAPAALAQNFGINEVNTGLAGSLTTADPRFIVGRIIQIVLGFLGVIAIGLIMYAGFLWTTSEGEEEKLDRAKTILRNAVIGLVIILSAWAIATFVLAKLMEATGTGSGPNAPFDNNNNIMTSSGAAALGACTVESVYPGNGSQDAPRNTSLMVTFKEELKLDGLCVNDSGAACRCDSTTCRKINPAAIQIYKSDLGNACTATCPSSNSNTTEVLVSVASDRKTLILTPLSLLGAADGNTDYAVKLTNQVKKADDSSMFKNCAADFLSWSFSVSNRLDLTPPLVSANGIFPLPDNVQDLFRVITPAAAASGVLTVNNCPKIYAPASVIDITPATAAVVLDYHGAVAQFKVAVPAEAPDKAQLFDGDNNLLGIADFDSSGRAIFKNYLTLTAASHPAGSLWTVNIKPEQLADTLTVGDEIYTFATDGINDNIAVPTVCSTETQIINIQAKLSGNAEVNISRGILGRLNLTAKVAGAAGNNIRVVTTAPGALAVTALTGGTDRTEIDQVNDKPDRPMNSAIQVNFSEPINPATISGTAAEVASYVRVVNANASSSPAGASCATNDECRSYKCESSVCVGDYLGGKFAVSNAYKTLEFISDRECGMNGCGEKIYCLPPSSHLELDLAAANLKSCTTDTDCLAYSPYIKCGGGTHLGYQTCQNPAGKIYPAANLSSLDGIVDAAANSFDGDRSQTAEGPVGFYNDNYPLATSTVTRDNYRWSFYVSDQINLTPPQITAVVPAPSQSGLSPAGSVDITFNALMLNSTLRTGQILIANGTSTAEHKFINLRSSTPAPLGYWIESDNRDIPPLDGEPDLTAAKIFHTPFPPSVTLIAQAGSGVKDIYQNCYKPSAGPGCRPSAEAPSCCFGTPTGTLGAAGNCQ
jgi:hypothetical protein